MDADAELDAPVLGHARVPLDEAVLDLDRAADRVDHAAEFDDRTVAGALDDAAMMSGYGRVDEIAAQTSQTRERTILVGAGEPAITDDIRHQNCRELPGFAHSAPLPQSNYTPLTPRSENWREGSRGNYQ